MKNQVYIKVFMRSKFKNKNVFFLSNNNYDNFNNISDNNNIKNIKKKENKRRFLEKFSLTTKKRKKGNLYGFMVQVWVKL